MIRFAIKGLAGRKLRSLLTAFAIVLGVAMVSGTYVLTDTIEKGFDTIFTRSYKNTDAVITGKEAFTPSHDGGAAAAPSFPDDLLSRVARVPGVAAASGSIQDEAKLIGANNKALGAGEAPKLAFGVNPGSDQRFNPLTLNHGEWPAGRDEIAIDRASAESAKLSVGERVRVAARGPVREFKIVGIASFGSVASIGGATMAIFDVPTAQELFDKRGKLDVIRVAGKPGVATDELLGDIRPLLPATASVKSAEVQAKQESAETSEFLGLLENALLAFGAIALFVGSFVIANTLSITIAQRVREFATLRTLGASRRQVLASVLAEALVLGAIASVAGLFLGLALAKGLNALFVAAGIDLPQGETVFAARTIVVSLVIGMVVTLLASLRPALRATRVPPIAAVREGSILPPTRFARFGVLPAVAVLSVGIAALLFGVLADDLSTPTRLTALGGGCLLLFLGVALVAPTFVRPLASSLGWPATRIGGISGELARENSMRNPSRTASTAAALMVGLALVTFVAVVGNGVRTPFEDSVDQLFVADYAVSAQAAFSPLAPAAGEAARRAPAVEVVSAVRQGAGRASGKEIFVTAVDRDVTRVLRFDWTQGSDRVPELLGQTGAIVKKKYAQEHHLAPGSQITLETPAGKTLALEVMGVFDEPTGGSPFGDVTISTETFDASYPNPLNLMTFVNTRGGVNAANTKELEAALRPFPDAKVVTAAQFKEDATKPLDDLLNLLYVLLGLSVIVSVFGIVNTLVLTVFERTRELGMLRAIGMTRRQVRRMIRHESIVTSLIGAALGIVVGLLLALLVAYALKDEGIVFAVPYGSLIVFVLAAIVAGLLAGILPARRAARLNVLRALQYE